MSARGTQPELPGAGKTGSSRERYRAYLVSEEWQQKRLAVFRRAGGLCEVCRKAPAREVHHKSYGTFGQERLEDLLALCPPCHRWEDEKLRTEREIQRQQARKRRLWS